MMFLCKQKNIFFSLFLFITIFFPSQKILAIEKNKRSDSQKIILDLFRGRLDKNLFSSFVKIKKPVPYQLKNLIKEPIIKKSLIKMTTNRSSKIPELILNWGSGSPKARTFKNQKVTNFFSNLFYEIIQMGKKNQLFISLNTTDLFHGHLVFIGKKKGDLIIVFHAQEYPHDLPFTSHNSRQAVVTHKLILKGKKFGHNTISFKKRNFIWSLKENKIFNLDTDRKGPFFPLIFPTGWVKDQELKELALLGNSVQDNLLGSNLGSLNFFPNQNIPLYWSP